MKHRQLLLTLVAVVLCSSTPVLAQSLDIEWDSLFCRSGYGLTVTNHGNAGNSGIGSINLDFVANGTDCTTADSIPADVYLYDLTPIIMQTPTNYSWQPYWTPARATSRDFQPVVSSDTVALQNYPEYSKYRSDEFLTSDRAISCRKHWLILRCSPDVSYIMERWSIYSTGGSELTDVKIACLVDWNIPTDTANQNLGYTDLDNAAAWMTGKELHSDQQGDCLDADRRIGYSRLFGYYTTSEATLDWDVNYTDLEGLHIASKPELFEPADTLNPDSVWNLLSTGGETVSTSGDDQVLLMNYGSFDIPAGDTLVICTMHHTSYDVDLGQIENDWIYWYFDVYMANRKRMLQFTCCGMYTGGYPGNVDCPPDGKRNLSDITRLIDQVYMSKVSGCCNAAMNVDADWDGKHGLADITLLIDHVYISKLEVYPCLQWTR